MEEKPKIDSKMNIVRVIMFFLIVCVIAFVAANYLINDEFRNSIDSKVLKKEISESTSNIIEINSDSNPHIYAYDKYIAVISKNILNLYNQDASIVSKIDVNITDPYVSTKGKYLAIGENGGNKLYLLSSTEVKWEKDIEEELYRVSVNKNGYVTVLLKNTTYKSIVIVYDNKGEELFRTYLATSYAICSEISENNKYLAIGQIDYSGTIVKSLVKLISIDLVNDNSQDSIIYTYESESSKILNNIKFNTKNELICMFDSYVQKITELSDEKIYDIKENDIFVDTNLENNIIVVEKENSGLFSYTYQVNIKNTVGKSDNLYILENEIPKRLIVNDNLICINLVNEVRVVNENGWLVKRYTTNNEIQDIVVRRKYNWYYI